MNPGSADVLAERAVKRERVGRLRPAGAPGVLLTGAAGCDADLLTLARRIERGL